VAPHSGISNVNCSSGLVSRLFAVAVLAAMTLALGACGRKGGLDLPPSASAVPVANGAAVTEPEAKAATAAQDNLFNSGNPSDKMRYAPKLPPKRIILDPILD
jgi:predicted small lipoprotein YifL